MDGPDPPRPSGIVPLASGGPSTGSASGFTHRPTPRGARQLVDDVDLLIDHLGRTLPGRLDSCFDDSRGDVPKPPGLPTPPCNSKAAFVTAWAQIAQRADAASQLGAGEDQDWPELPADLVFLVRARDFLAALVYPATVDSIRLTRAYVSAMAAPLAVGAWFRRISSLRSTHGARQLGERLHEVLGRRIALTIWWMRWICLALVFVTLLVSLSAFGGKRILEAQDRSLAFLGTITTEIAAEPGQRPGAAGAEAPQKAVFGNFMVVANATTYCDQPFMDDEGVIRYATLRQDTLCNRLWGVNRQINQLARQLETWSGSLVNRIALVFASLTVGSEPSFERIFPEAARSASLQEAMAVAALRINPTGNQTATEVSEELRTLAEQLQVRALQLATLRRLEPLQHRATDGASPTQALAMIEGLSLYVMPCLYALLGAFVAVFRGLRARAAAHMLERSEADTAVQMVLLGLVFGAVVGILADLLRAAPTTGNASDEVVLGVSVIALLAGYAVEHVFRFLDSFADRLFGPLRPTSAETIPRAAV